ncbi:MAG: hypothetical protein ACD_49C00079G0005 [uncultured bacterium (gcode 4)]|uniref:HTH arsR-type domain-containing protein n=1 Tax=uncultured bacterium (gcode 4) TaxID=1234023 RepID=K2AVY2_9BACT|nr:MAG: hypothetical protein ACD_49C00079G0005 [uncultured bacterium (gcode 4)]
MKTDTREKIMQIISLKYPIWVTQISNILGFSNEIIHRHLKKLINENKIYKVGSPPKVYYFPVVEVKKNIISIKREDSEFLLNNFLEFTPDGQILYWIEWFQNWCEKRWLDTLKELEIYKKTQEKYNRFKNNFLLIDWMEKMKNTFEKVYLDEVYYLDFYSIEKYWKTLLGNLMFYWKQTADKEIIYKVLNYIKNPIENLINAKNIDSFAFIPPSIKRKIQILDELKKWLNINLKELKLLKIFKDKIVSQKSLNKKEDRIINARDTIFIKNKDFVSDKILLIDDAVGSWSTLNETAKKIKESWISKYVIWIAIVGSYKGFEIINEV